MEDRGGPQQHLPPYLGLPTVEDILGKELSELADTVITYVFNMPNLDLFLSEASIRNQNRERIEQQQQQQNCNGNNRTRRNSSGIDIIKWRISNGGIISMIQTYKNVILLERDYDERSMKMIETVAMRIGDKIDDYFYSKIFGYGGGSNADELKRRLLSMQNTLIRKTPDHDLFYDSLFTERKYFGDDGFLCTKDGYTNGLNLMRTKWIAELADETPELAIPTNVKRMMDQLLVESPSIQSFEPNGGPVGSFLEIDFMSSNSGGEKLRVRLDKGLIQNENDMYDFSILSNIIYCLYVKLWIDTLMRSCQVKNIRTPYIMEPPPSPPEQGIESFHINLTRVVPPYEARKDLNRFYGLYTGGDVMRCSFIHKFMHESRISVPNTDSERMDIFLPLFLCIEANTGNCLRELTTSTAITLSENEFINDWHAKFAFNALKDVTVSIMKRQTLRLIERNRKFLIDKYGSYEPYRDKIKVYEEDVPNSVDNVIRSMVALRLSFILCKFLMRKGITNTRVPEVDVARMPSARNLPKRKRRDFYLDFKIFMDFMESGHRLRSCKPDYHFRIATHLLALSYDIMNTENVLSLIYVTPEFYPTMGLLAGSVSVMPHGNDNRILSAQYQHMSKQNRISAFESDVINERFSRWCLLSLCNSIIRMCYDTCILKWNDKTHVLDHQHTDNNLSMFYNRNNNRNRIITHNDENDIRQQQGNGEEEENIMDVDNYDMNDSIDDLNRHMIFMDINPTEDYDTIEIMNRKVFIPNQAVSLGEIINSPLIDENTAREMFYNIMRIFWGNPYMMSQLTRIMAIYANEFNNTESSELFAGWIHDMGYFLETKQCKKFIDQHMKEYRKYGIDKRGIAYPDSIEKVYELLNSIEQERGGNRTDNKHKFPFRFIRVLDVIKKPKEINDILKRPIAFLDNSNRSAEEVMRHGNDNVLRRHQQQHPRTVMLAPEPYTRGYYLLLLDFIQMLIDASMDNIIRKIKKFATRKGIRV